jgi:hypothetical protein
VRNRFTDRAPGGLGSYDWHVNHDEEEDGGKNREITLSANTSGLGLVRQQGAPDPFTFKLSGAILHQDQYTKFWRYFDACQSRTIFWRDFTGDEYEVVITSFTPRRIRGQNTADPTIPHHFWRYTMELQVLRVESGSLAGVVTP